jgi:hypothetical protein
MIMSPDTDAIRSAAADAAAALLGQLPATAGAPVRHAQAAQDWSLAARLLSDHWVDLDLGGQAATARELLTRFPAGVAAFDAELLALTAAAELARGSLEEAERQLALAIQRSASVPADRLGRFEVMLTVLRLYLARQRGDLPAVAEAADGLLAAVEAPDEPWLSLGEDLRSLTLITLGMAEVWAFRFKDANQLVGSGDRPRAVGVGAHGPHAHPPRVRQARRARSDGGGDAGPCPRPARTVFPCALRFSGSWHQQQQDRLTRT